MRRSAAPSSQSAAKRLRFLSPFLNSTIDLEENDFFHTSKTKCSSTVAETVPKKLEDAFSTTCEDSASSSTRKTDEILKLLFEPTAEDNISIDNGDDLEIPTSTQKMNACNVGIAAKSLPTMRRKTIVKDDKAEVKRFAGTLDVENVDSDRYYNVLWCKRSAKKHKVWEGDGVLIVKSRSAVLKNASGKVIDRGIGYKLKEIEEIEDGGKFFIGGKECEIQFEISPKEYKSLENSDSPGSDVSVPQSCSKKTNLCM